MKAQKKIIDRVSTLLISLAFSFVLILEANPSMLEGWLGTIDPNLAKASGVIIAVIIIVLNAITPEWRANAAKVKGYDQARDELLPQKELEVVPETDEDVA